MIVRCTLVQVLRNGAGMTALRQSPSRASFELAQYAIYKLQALLHCSHTWAHHNIYLLLYIDRDIDRHTYIVTKISVYIITRYLLLCTKYGTSFYKPSSSALNYLSLCIAHCTIYFSCVLWCLSLTADLHVYARASQIYPLHIPISSSMSVYIYKMPACIEIRPRESTWRLWLLNKVQLEGLDFQCHFYFYSNLPPDIMYILQTFLPLVIYFISGSININFY